jgi:chromate reductase, NAD(P)H dehydrogenase (quinone)
VRILVLGGSLRAKSTNAALARAVGSVAAADTTADVFDRLGEIPPFSTDIGDDDAPPAVTDLRARIAAADGVVVSTPEYAHGVPGVVKNALDWLVGSGELADKPTALVSSSPDSAGGVRAMAALAVTLTVMGVRLVDIVTVPLLRTRLDAGGELADPSTRRKLASALESIREGVAATTADSPLRLG